MRLLQCMFSQNPNYRKGTFQPSGIVVHSTGANNPELRRYAQPQKGQTAGLMADGKEVGYYEMLRLLGTNRYNNDWNRASQSLCVHAFVGKMADGQLASVQVLPWNKFTWGCGSGRNGSFNSNHIQFEICEDRTDREYTKKAYLEAVELVAYLCKQFDLPVSSVVSHKEAGVAGYASGHVDPDHWFNPLGFSMDGFREDVQDILNGGKVEAPPDYRKMLKDRAGLEEQTMAYLEKYKYGTDLIRKLATMK